MNYFEIAKDLNRIYSDLLAINDQIEELSQQKRFDARFEELLRLRAEKKQEFERIDKFYAQ